ncbi:MAG: ferritin-like domain-containing protein [Nanoarchaeota archaeon]
MGQKGKEIVSMDVNNTVQSLTKAYAFEWVVHYYASLASNIVSGLHSATFEKIFAEGAEGELGHANRIAKRLAELGAEPPRTFEEIEKIAGFGKVNFPKDTSDIKGFLKVFIEMERHAIGLYQELATKTHGKDLVTHELAEDLLAEEVAEEEEYENMLK